MKLPLSPPSFEALFDKYNVTKHYLKMISWHTFPNKFAAYLHWDKLRHLDPPDNWSIEEVWFALKCSRLNNYKQTVFVDKHKKSMLYGTPDRVQYLLFKIDQDYGRSIQSTASILNADLKNTYLLSSLIEEAITSSQLEGASTTRKVAIEMLRTQRKPSDQSEQMIMNNYHTMQFVREMKNEPLTVKFILKLHQIVTNKNLDEAKSGAFRTTEDNVNVCDDRDNTVLHTPPNAKSLQNRMQKICDYANNVQQKNFVHPIVKAIIIHFMMAYDHPFVDGNGRTARALFYWFLMKKGYWLMEYISISSILKKAPSKYAKAFLYTETDDNDMTYFIIQQLEVILKACQCFEEYIAKQIKELKETERLVDMNHQQSDALNHRQISILKKALKHPNLQYTIGEHKNTYQISYQTARTDLLSLEKLNYFERKKLGKAFVFKPVDNLKSKLS